MASANVACLPEAFERPAGVHTMTARASLAVGRHADALEAVRCARRSTGTPAGRPSTTTVSAGPWDSPAVRKRSIERVGSRGARSA